MNMLFKKTFTAFVIIASATQVSGVHAVGSGSGLPFAGLLLPLGAYMAYKKDLGSIFFRDIPKKKITQDHQIKKQPEQSTKKSSDVSTLLKPKAKIVDFKVFYRVPPQHSDNKKV